MNLKLKVLLGGIMLITIISLILASFLDCTIYGSDIVYFDMISIFLWIGGVSFIMRKK